MCRNFKKNKYWYSQLVKQTREGKMTKETLFGDQKEVIFHDCVHATKNICHKKTMFYTLVLHFRFRSLVIFGMSGIVRAH